MIEIFLAGPNQWVELSGPEWKENIGINDQLYAQMLGWA